MPRWMATALVCVLLPGCQSPPLHPDSTVGDATIIPEDLRAGDIGIDGDRGCVDPPDLTFDGSDVTVADGFACDTAPDSTPSDLPLLDLALQDAAPDAPTGDGPTGDVPAPCPPCMVLVSSFCIDRYEASRPDATQTSPGTQSGAAQCKKGVMPWHTGTLTQAEAAAACVAAGKRLCTAAEWKAACSGPQGTTYGYGNPYQPATCNGIDTFCYCGAGSACASVKPCPYPHCFNQPPPGGTPAQGCGASLHVTPTGAHPGCVNGWGLFDMNGNVWEVVQSSDGLDHFRGGAYNCSDSELLHRCDYDATWGPSGRGFRCCGDPAAQP